MSFNLYYSNHLDTLQYIAGYLTKVDPQASPFDKEYFLVQNFGMARWMQIKLAKQLGILTQSEFLLPSKMLMNLLEMTFTEEERTQRPIERLSKDQLFWPLVTIIQEIIDQDSALISTTDTTLFTPISDYLEKYAQDAMSKRPQNPLLGVLHLAEELAGIFDKYIVYRSHWINAWTKGEMAPPHFDNVLPIELEAWQATLFKRLYETLGKPLHFGMLHPLIDAKLQDPHIQEKLPKRIFIIGLNSLPPLFLDLIAQFSKVIDIHLFFNNPSQYYWGDLTKDAGLPSVNLTSFFSQEISAIDQISPHIPEEVLGSLDEHWQNSYGNPLLASLGKVGRDHLHLLQKYDGDLALEITEAFAEPEVDSLLSKIQSEIFHLRPVRETTPYLIAEGDRSIQLHHAYSPMREVEALYNQILHQLETSPSLEPEDIVVMTPDIESYAPFINAVFGSAPKDRYLPYSISDVSLKESDTIFTTLLHLLALPESAFKASDLLLLLQMPEIMEQFHFEESDLSLIHFWIHDANIKQAIDGVHLTDELQTPYNNQFDWDINTWRWGLQRMLLGYGSTDAILPLSDEMHAPHSLLAYPHIEGKTAEVLGNLCYFIDCLIETKNNLAGDKSVKEWQAILPKVWQTFFTQSSTNNDKLHFTQKAWLGLLSGAQTVNFTDKIPLKALTPMLENKLLEEKPEQNFIQGKITFCSFIPMRTIPFKMIAMIGMNQSDFPKSTMHHSFDLIQYQAMRGDRSRSIDDRYLFLEAILSAKESLYLSFIGKSIRDNSDLFPSLLIDELMRYIDQIAITESGSAASAQITYHHPMASYNAGLFSPNNAIWSFQDEWILNQEDAAFYNAAYDYETLLENFDAQQKITPLTELSLDSLIRFYQDPCQYFAEQRLHLSPLRDYTTLIEDDEKFTINKGLDEYQFHQALTEALLKACITQRDSGEPALCSTFKLDQTQDHADQRSLLAAESSDQATIIEGISQSLYQQYHLEGRLPKFAFGELSWLEKSELPKSLTQTLIAAHFPYGAFMLKRFKKGITLHGKIPQPSIHGDIILWDVGNLKHDRLMKGAITNLFYHATKPEDDIQKTLWFIGKGTTGIEKTTFPYYTKQEAIVELTHLINGYLFGIKGPIPYLYLKENGNECFNNEVFKEVMSELSVSCPEWFGIEKSEWRPESFRILLKDDIALNSLSETTRNLLNKVKSLLSGNNSFNRLFPLLGEKEVFAFLLFYHHYLNELMPHE